MIPVPEYFSPELNALIRQLAPMRWRGDRLQIIDQRLLPEKEVWFTLENVSDLMAAIGGLAVRGAPALGIAGAFGVVCAIRQFKGKRRLREEVLTSADRLKSSRPTAVNLAWGIDSVLNEICWDHNENEIFAQAVSRSLYLWRDDLERSWKLAGHFQYLIKDGMHLLTHCNAGGLATGGLGTALAPMFLAAIKNKAFHVWVDETRPLLQGSRLTAWELNKAGIPHTVIADNMAASRMAGAQIDLIITGADRIACNGDTANKIGTYNLAILANWHHIPFYIAAPESTFDRSTAAGRGIPIEMRSASELTEFNGVRVVHKEAAVYNPAFDVTPAELITGIVTEQAKYEFPYNFSV